MAFHLHIRYKNSYNLIPLTKILDDRSIAYFGNSCLHTFGTKINSFTRHVWRKQKAYVCVGVGVFVCSWCRSQAQSFLISKVQSHSRCICLSSSVKTELTEQVPRENVPEGASSAGVRQNCISFFGGQEPTICFILSTK